MAQRERERKVSVDYISEMLALKEMLKVESGKSLSLDFF
jgi:hypothetical protein